MKARRRRNGVSVDVSYFGNTVMAFLFLFFINLFIFYLFIFGCVWSSLLCAGSDGFSVCV